MKDIEKIIEILPEDERVETKEFLDGLNPIAGIDSKEKAADFIDKNEFFLKAKDSFISKGNDAFRDNHFKIELDKAVKEKVEEYIKEQNPKETDEQKLIRELQEKDKARDLKDFKRDQKEILMKKAMDDKLPGSLNLDLLIGEDENRTIKNYESITTPFLETIKDLTEKLEKEKTNTGMPLKGSPIPKDIINPFLPGSINVGIQTMLYKEDKKLYDKYLAESRNLKQ